MKKILIFIFLLLMLTLSACNPDTKRIAYTDTPFEKATLTMKPTPTKEEIGPLEVDFGLKSEDIPVSENGMAVDEILKMWAETASNRPYQKFVYVQGLNTYEEKVIYSNGLYSPKVFGETYLQRFKELAGGLTIIEPDIFEKVLDIIYRSEYSVGDTSQVVILVTEEIGEDGVKRNGVFSYSEGGIAIYIGKGEEGDRDIKIFKGGKITTDDPEVRSLFEQGYTQVRMIEGEPKGFFNINELPSRKHEN